MRLKSKVWLLTSLIVGLIMTADVVVGRRALEQNIREELERDARDFRAILMATRRVYHKQFMASGLPINDRTVGFLPAHALSRISKDFPNWSHSGLYFNNVSDQPRNPANQADAYELGAMAWFRTHPRAESRLVEIHLPDGEDYYHFTTPIWIEKYCLGCHGARAAAPSSIAADGSFVHDAAFMPRPASGRPAQRLRRGRLRAPDPGPGCHRQCTYLRPGHPALPGANHQPHRYRL